MPARFVLLVVSFLAVAAAPPVPRVKSAEKKEPFAEADGTVVVAGKKIDYKTTAGRLALKDRTGKASANIFFVAYTKKGVARVSERPLTFCFNGGPGSSSVWLHLGAFGPRRVLLSDDGKSAARPTKLVANEWSLLDLTDLVFIDPVSTGFSRADDPKEAKQFHGVEEDVQSVGEFIRLYISRYNRSTSPKYLAGESYGTTRAAGLSSYLQDRAGIRLNGIVLISAVLDFQTILFNEGNDLTYAVYLPTFTAAAWYHKKLNQASTGDLFTVVEQSRRFAEGEYAQALRKGNRLTDGERNALAKKLSSLTGLSEEFVLKSNLRVDLNRFRRELLRDRNETIGRYDSRVTAGSRGGGGRGDPSYTVVSGPFTSAMNSYLLTDLSYKSSLRYQINNAPVRPWNYGPAGTNRYLNVAPRLRTAMEKNPSLRVLVVNGYFDLATPFAGTEYTFAHMGDRSLANRVTLSYYESGHMVYTHNPSLRKLKADIAKFMRGGSARPVDVLE